MSKTLDPEKIIIRAHVTEKSIKLLETQNILTFIVDRRANKKQIKYAIEKLFNVKVKKVRTLITPDNKKKAYVRLSSEFNAEEIASKLGII